MPVRIALAAAALLLILAWPAWAADRCHPRGSRTLEANAHVRVFAVRHGRARVIFGCLRRRGRPVRLVRNVDTSSDLNGDTLEEILVAGTSVALVQESFSDFGVEGDEYETLVVDDLSAGGRRFRRHIEENDYDLYDVLAAVRLRPDGAAAWTLTTKTDKYVEVDVLPPRSRIPTALVFARGIEPLSLALTGAAVSWTQDGARRSAPLP